MKKLCFRMTLLIILGPVSLAVGAGGQDEIGPEAYRQYPEALGGQAGEISGNGISYQQWIDRTGVQLTGGIIYVPLSEAELSWLDSTLDYNVGVELQFRIFGADLTSWLSGQLYAFFGLMHRGYIPIVEVEAGYYENEWDWIDGVYATGSFRPVVGLGGGIGTEIILFRHFSIPIEIGYSVNWSPLSGSLADQFDVNLRPQIGARYRY